SHIAGGERQMRRMAEPNSVVRSPARFAKPRAFYIHLLQQPQCCEQAVAVRLRLQLRQRWRLIRHVQIERRHPTLTGQVLTTPRATDASRVCVNEFRET